MNPIRLVLMVLAVILFALAAFGISTPRGNLVAGGLACWALATMIA